MSCPGEETIFAFAEGRLPAAVVARVEAHAATCALCQDLLAAALATGTLGHGGAGPSRMRAAPTGEDTLARGTAVGRYTMLALVGSGGMGQVYAAYDPELDRKVALKLLSEGGRDAARVRARLLREAKALAKLSHPNVVSVHDVGTFRGRVFIAMEFVDGPTFEAWLATGARPRAEILRVFAAAARGLAAAHAAGLVHRDFKPSNVMLAPDGSVRVMDFGLARSLADAPDDDAEAPAAASALDPRLTRTGERLGTPLYMAPEQFAARPADARTDQFSFCVALYRALYGVAPFRADSLDALAATVLAGRVELAPPKSDVPAWLRRVVLRGLSAEPAARWPTMSALVAALERDPARTRRRLALAAGVLSLVGLSAVTVASGGRGAPLCLAGPARLAGVWESAGPAPHPRRDAVERAILTSGAPAAREVWERLAAALDRYRAGWLAMYRTACEATNVRHEQTSALLDLQMTCLDERRGALSALTDVLLAADREVASSAVKAANALPPLDRCADRRELEAGVEPPRDAATRARVEDIRSRAAIAKALNDTGKHVQAQELARAQLAEARATTYRPLVAEMLTQLDRDTPPGHFAEEAVSIEEEAVWTSLAVGRDELAAQTAIALVATYGNYLARYDESRAWSHLSAALLDRAGGGHEILRAWLLENDAGSKALHGELATALPLFQRSIALKETILPPDHPDLAIGIGDEAEALARMGRHSDALALNGRAHEIFVRAYGPSSIEAAYTLSNRSEYLLALGRSGEALEASRRALAVWEAQLGPNDPNLGYPLTAQGRALLGLARPQDAVPPLEHALRVREAGDGNALNVAETRFALARALEAAHANGQRAAVLARRARAAYAAAGDDRHAGEIDAWLAATSDRRR